MRPPVIIPPWVARSCARAGFVGPEGWWHTWEMDTDQLANQNLSVVVAKFWRHALSMFTLYDHVHLKNSGKSSNYHVELLTIKSGLLSIYFQFHVWNYHGISIKLIIYNGGSNQNDVTKKLLVVLVVESPKNNLVKYIKIDLKKTLTRHVLMLSPQNFFYPSWLVL